jgi:copper(I)-binding protein
MRNLCRYTVCSMVRLMLAAALILLCPAAVIADTPSVIVRDAWIAEAPPVARVLACYMTIENPSDREQVLTRVTSPLFSDIEIHRTELRDGIARMWPESKLVILPKGKVVFQRGGYHLMLINPVRPLHAGDTVDLTLEFEKGLKLTVNAAVRSAELDIGLP